MLKSSGLHVRIHPYDVEDRVAINQSAFLCVVVINLQHHQEIGYLQISKAGKLPAPVIHSVRWATRQHRSNERINGWVI
jgi:hypothetical protein